VLAVVDASLVWIAGRVIGLRHFHEGYVAFSRLFGFLVHLLGRHVVVSTR
jgi:hypothetical protein